MGRGKSRRTRLIFASMLAAVILVAAHDVGSKPGDGLAARAAIRAIDSYRANVSPRISRFVVCRFQPTCSAYGRDAIAKYGLLRGGGKTAWRIAKCGPWTKAGTVDLP